MATEIVQIIDFFGKISFDALVFKVLVFENDLELWIEVNEYYK